MSFCFSSAERQGKKAVILCSEMAGEWVFICMCVRVEGGGRGEDKVLKKRRQGALRERSESSDVSIDLLNTGTFTPFDFFAFFFSS